MKKHLHSNMRLVALLIALFLGTGTAFADYDFSAVCESGQTLYYNIIDATNFYVELTYPGNAAAGNYWDGYESPTGDITLPSQISYNGVDYTVTQIGGAAFSSCSGLTGSLVIPNTVTIIKPQAFYQTGFTGTLTLGSSVTTIYKNAFSHCGFTGSLTIPNSVTSIGDFAFAGCSGFTGTLSLGDALTTIGESAFKNCSGFTGTLTIPNSLTTMGRAAFLNCSGFTQVNYNATNCSDVAYSQNNNYPFTGCVGTLVIGDNVERIPAFMFAYANFTGSLTIPDSVTEIGTFAFRNCSGFTGSLTLSNALNTIGEWAFGYCNFTGQLTIPNSVTIIVDDAFYGCNGFTGMLTIGSSVSEIGYQAFHLGNVSITAITVLAETPPELENNNVFFIVGMNSIPVYVPRASLSSYLEDEGWSGEFSIITYAVTVTATAMPSAGGTVTGQGLSGYGLTCTMTATPNTNYLFLHWSKNGEVVSCNATYEFTLEDDTDLEAVFMSIPNNVKLIGQGETTSTNLPCNSYYKYCLTQQIYTAEEMGMSRTITTISFFNAGSTKTRYYDIYMTHTSKTSFSSDSDWIAVNESQRVYSGFVEMKQGVWTTIPLDQPFSYQNTYSGGTSLALIVDDNTGIKDRGMECRTYPTGEASQAIFMRGNATNPDPLDLSSFSGGGRVAEKNQIMFNRTLYSVVADPSDVSEGTVTGAGQYGANEICKLQAIPNEGYFFMDWTDQEGAVVSTDAEYSFVVENDVDLTANFLPEGDYCDLTFDLNDSYGDGWNGNYLVVNFGNGMSQRLAIPTGEEASMTLPVASGSHVALSWVVGSYTYECSFTVSYTDGDLVYQSSGLGADFGYEFDVDCSETVTQTLELSAGWNWISSYIAFDDPEEALLQLEEALGVNGLTIKSKDDYTTYEEGEWGAMGDLEELDNVQMYMIQVAAACTAELVGMPANTESYEITLTKGWNWIGFPSAVPISLEDAFADFEPADGDRIKSRSDFSSYDSEEGWGATGDLEELTPGEGFMYYSNSDAPKTLVFSVGSK